MRLFVWKLAEEAPNIFGRLKALPDCVSPFPLEGLAALRDEESSRWRRRSVFAYSSAIDGRGTGHHPFTESDRPWSTCCTSAAAASLSLSLRRAGARGCRWAVPGPAALLLLFPWHHRSPRLVERKHVDGTRRAALRRARRRQRLGPARGPSRPSCKNRKIQPVKKGREERSVQKRVRKLCI